MEKIEKGRHSISKEPLISVSDQSGLDAKEVMLKIASFLRRSGYRVGIGEIQGSGETLFASRGRYASLATLVFHISLFAVAGGILLGALYSTRGSIVMAEGERFTGKQSEYTIFYPKDRYNKRVSAFSFKVDDVQPRFWGRRLLFTDLYADLSYPRAGADKTVRVRLNSPWLVKAGTYVSIINIGYAPRYEIRDSRNQVIEDGFVKLVTFPPGTTDSFKTSLGDLKVVMKVYPDHRVDEKVLTTASMNLKDPAYDVVVSSGKKKVFSGHLLPGESGPLGQGFSLSFPDIRYWGEFRVINNPGLPWLWAGFLIASIVVAWRLFFYRRGISIVIGEKGRLLVKSKFDYFQDLNEVLLSLKLEKLLGIELERKSKDEPVAGGSTRSDLFPGSDT